MPRPLSFDPALLSLRLQASGPASAQSLAAALGVDRLTVQRAMRRLGASVVQLGTTRGTRYAATRAIHGQSGPSKIVRFGVNGVVNEWAELTPLHGGWRLEWTSTAMKPDWADQVHDRVGFCEGLPFFLADLRPQGFLGRAIARRLPTAFGLSGDPRDWSDDHTLLYLREWGDDAPGNLVVGLSAMLRALNEKRTRALDLEARAEFYPKFAEQAVDGALVGSSVEGEQPKFTAWLHFPPTDEMRAVLVKFTDRLDTPTGRRWADMLAAEAIALDLLTWASRGDSEAAAPKSFDFGARRFYQIERFDRIGAHGRRGVVTLRALHDAGFTGRDTNDWVVAATGLNERGWVSESDLRAIRLRQLFGRLIGNTDMHFGNLAFFLDLELPLKLAPTYDMLPMLWAPRPGDATPAPEFAPSAPLPAEMELWPEAAPLAEKFWERVETDARVSDAFRPLAGSARQAIKRLRARFG